MLYNEFMATIFPSNPTLNQEYEGYKWNGTAWKIIGASLTDITVMVDFPSYGDLKNGKEFLTNYS